ncbi:hypothetical protein PQR33_22735 [Paraburkholderia sediminicola]|uniref:hypothetical protein n=1 Tax=Paraburkholderia sediminicola TaxID=458836 RepID=UPI0038B8CFC7
MRTRVSLIPAEAGDPNKWAPVPEAAFEGKEKRYETYQRRELAVRLYFQNVPYLQIQSETGICKKEVIRHVKACVSSVAGVGFSGFYALIPYRRRKEYERTEPTTGAGKPLRDGENREKGYAGAFEQLLKRFEHIRQHMHDCLEGNIKQKIPEARMRRKTIWKDVLSMFKAAGVSISEWPFRTESKGRSAIYNYCRRYVEDNPRTTDREQHGEKTAQRRKHDPTEDRALPRMRALSCLQMDYSKIDAASIFEIVRQDGTTVEVTIARWYWGMLWCPEANAAVGFHVSLSRNPATADAIGILESAAYGLDLDGLDVEVGSGEDGRVLINAFFPKLKGHGMSIIRVDNGWANKASETIRTMMRIYGCAINLGKVASWLDRVEIERAFRSVTREGPARVASTYGTDPTDGRRTNPNKVAIEKRIRLKDVIHILARAVRDRNIANTSALEGASPVQVIGELLENTGSGVFPMPLPIVGYPEWMRFAAVERATVRVGGKESLRLPYLEKWGATYTADSLFSTDRHVNKPALMLINRRDVNQAVAIMEETLEEIGELTVTGVFRDKVHTIAERKEVNQKGRRGHIENLEREVSLQPAPSTAKQSTKGKRGASGDVSSSQEALAAAKRQSNPEVRRAAEKDQEADKDSIVGVAAEAPRSVVIPLRPPPAIPAVTAASPTPKQTTAPKKNRFGIVR